MPDERHCLRAAPEGREILIERDPKEESGGAGEIRTPDTQFRKLLLYPSELQPHGSIVIRLFTQRVCAEATVSDFTGVTKPHKEQRPRRENYKA